MYLANSICAPNLEDPLLKTQDLRIKNKPPALKDTRLKTQDILTWSVFYFMSRLRRTLIHQNKAKT